MFNISLRITTLALGAALLIGSKPATGERTDRMLSNCRWIESVKFTNDGGFNAPATQEAAECVGAFLPLKALSMLSNREAIGVFFTSACLRMEGLLS